MKSVSSQFNIRITPLLIITIFILILHFSLVIFAYLQGSRTPLPKNKSRLIVKTVQLHPTSKAETITIKPKEIVETPQVETIVTPISEAPEVKEKIEIEPKTEKSLEKPQVETKVTPISEAPEVKKNIKTEPKTEKSVEKPQVETKVTPISEAPEVKKKIKTEPKTEKNLVKPTKKANAATSKSPQKKTETKAKTVEKKTTVKTVSTAKPKKIEPKSENKKEQLEKRQSNTKEKVQDSEKNAVIEKQQKLLAQAKENLAKIHTNHDTISGGSVLVPIPTIESLGKLQIDALSETQADLNEREANYIDELVARLKMMLKLPEYGKVKLKLTLERSGHVAKMVIVSAESQKNRKYVEQTLPKTHFPQFGNNFNDQTNYTFQLVLSNDL